MSAALAVAAARTCGRCSEVLHVSEFYSASSRCTWCKPCCREYQRQRYMTERMGPPVRAVPPVKVSDGPRHEAPAADDAAALMVALRDMLPRIGFTQTRLMVDTAMKKLAREYPRAALQDGWIV